MAEGGFTTLKFNGTEFIRRWSARNRHEFTPAGDDDPTQWRQMVAVSRYPEVRDGDALAAQVGDVLEAYQQAGDMVLRAASVPSAEEYPAEYFIAAVLARPGYIEIVLARFSLVAGVGLAATFSQRFYGTDVGGEVSDWLQAHGAVTELALMGWTLPAVFAVEALEAAPLPE